MKRQFRSTHLSSTALMMYRVTLAIEFEKWSGRELWSSLGCTGHCQDSRQSCIVVVRIYLAKSGPVRQADSILLTPLRLPYSLL